MKLARHWLRDLFILWAWCNILVGPGHLACAEVVEFAIGDQVQIISDKVYRYTKQKLFQAVGNVVVLHRDNAIYGEKASLNLQTGEITFAGNIRFVAPQAVLYGSELYYNLKTHEAVAKNARFITENISLVGKQITRRADNTFFGDNIEYTSCQDCPESWSVLGRSLRLKVGEYVHLKHAYIKAKGVPVFYSPYIVFPIKDKRQSGFLFPNLSVGRQGLLVQAPWYYAGQHFDFTLTPTSWGTRGLGGQFEYRHLLGDQRWILLHSLQSADQIYRPGKYNEEKSGQKFYRHFTRYEHHWHQGVRWSHHLRAAWANDLDVVRDYDNYLRTLLQGPDLEMDTFVTYRHPYGLVSLEAFDRRNQLVPNERSVDKTYVQIIPRLTLATVPWTFWQGQKWPSRLTGQALAEFTIFQQHRRTEDRYLRNARRLNFTPAITWNIYNGQAWRMQTKVQGDFQAYQFAADHQKSFQKSAILHESEISLKAEKIWGVAYQDHYPVAQESSDWQPYRPTTAYPVISDLPVYRAAQNQDEQVVRQASFRHQQEWKLKHYGLSYEGQHGNAQFREQIQHDEGRFDFVDAPRAMEVEVPNLPRKKRIPLKNTLELQWNNTFQRKDPVAINPYEDGRDLRHNFTYQQVSYLDLSQGIDLAYRHHQNTTQEQSRLTRLLVEGGLYLGKGQVYFSESYYHKNKRHILDVGTYQRFASWSARFAYARDFLVNPRKDLAKLDLRWTLSDHWFFQVATEYDFHQSQFNDNEIGLVFFPSGRCWQLALNYRATLIEKGFHYHFSLNFSRQVPKALDLL